MVQGSFEVLSHLRNKKVLMLQIRVDLYLILHFQMIVCVFCETRVQLLFTRLIRYELYQDSLAVSSNFSAVLQPGSSSLT